MHDSNMKGEYIIAVCILLLAAFVVIYGHAARAAQTVSDSVSVIVRQANEISDSVLVRVGVVPPPPSASFRLTHEGEMKLTLGSQESNTVKINAEPENGFSGPVILSLSSISPDIPGARGVFSSEELGAGNYSSTFKIVLDQPAPAGAYTVTVQGRSGGVVRTVTIPLNSKGKNPSFEEF